MKKLFFTSLIIIFSAICAFAQDELLIESAYNVNETAAPVVLADVKGVVYITGIGCSNCAIVDPFLFS
ncbi:MAG: hypothetical protein WC214_00005, partial [Candidatus Omnitrophota bacterium]